MRKLITLSGPYSGFRARRLEQKARVRLVKVIGYFPGASEHRGPAQVYETELNPYFLVQLTNFDETRDRPFLIEAGSTNWGNGTKRFLNESDAKSFFNRLTNVPALRLEAEKDQKRIEDLNARLKQYRDSGQAGKTHLRKNPDAKSPDHQS